MLKFIKVYENRISIHTRTIVKSTNHLYPVLLPIFGGLNWAITHCTSTRNQNQGFCLKILEIIEGQNNYENSKRKHVVFVLGGQIY